MAIKHSIRHLCTHMRKKRKLHIFTLAKLLGCERSTRKVAWNNKTIRRKANNVAQQENIYIYIGKTKQMNKKAPHISCAICPHCFSLPKISFHIVYTHPKHRMSNTNKSCPWALHPRINERCIYDVRFIPFSSYRTAYSFYEIAYFAHANRLSFRV